ACSPVGGPSVAPAAESAVSSPSLAPTKRPFPLDCGPLDQSKCDAAADEIVRRATGRYGANIVLSIRFTDGCGSAMVALANGKAESMIIECAQPN
ncbi:MAG TPA: hypothetical protein VGC90_08420, partial [Candidatus Limnocylindrales bacterium]